MSPKHCPTCSEQGNCISSRQAENWISRRYECGCGKRWTTTETHQEEWFSGKLAVKKLSSLKDTLKGLV